MWVRKQRKWLKHTGQQQRGTEFLADCSLNHGISSEVHGRSRFVQYDNRATTQQSTSHSDQLPLSLREICPTRRYLRVQRYLGLGVDIGWSGRYRRLCVIVDRRRSRCPLGLGSTFIDEAYSVQHVEALIVTVFSYNNVSENEQNFGRFAIYQTDSDCPLESLKIVSRPTHPISESKLLL